MWGFALSWLRNNKLSAVLVVVVVVMAAVIAFGKLKIEYLQAKNTTLTERVAAQQATLERLRALGERQKARLTKAEREVARRKKAYKVLYAKLQQAQVPKKCPEAVTWGSVQINKLMKDLR